ncbi:MAG: hypothetical protein HRU19_17540 [Pseudobacteriovorax sp.]|nr:hypothetical protein [Pseudobacteriovorax sp.]
MDTEKMETKAIKQNDAAIRSRSALYQLITRTEESELAEERFQSNLNPYRSSESGLFSLVKSPNKPKRPSEATG